MANEKVSEQPSLLNLQDDDLIEITKYMGVGLGDDGGDYKSYQMSYAVFSTFNSPVEKLGNLKSSDTPSLALTDSVIEAVAIKVVSGTGKFKIGSTAGGSELMQLTDEISEDFYQAVFIPCYSVTAYPRVTGLGTLKVTLFLRNNIF